MNRALKAGILVAMIAAFGAAICWADPFLLGLVVFAGLIYLGLPCLAIALILLLVAIASRRSLRPPVLLISGLLAFAAIAGTSIFINRIVQEQAVVAAKAYPDQVAPLLERFRQEHGQYPSTLDQLPSRPRVPRLLRTKYGYRSDGQHYSFCFSQPGGLIDMWDYSSDTRTWNLST